MTFGTHVAFASVLYLGGTTLFGYKPDWAGWLLVAVAAKGEIFVQFWLKPGEQAVAFEVGNELPEEPIPEELRRFL